jgi:hypothetical protein
MVSFRISLMEFMQSGKVATGYLHHPRQGSVRDLDVDFRGEEGQHTCNAASHPRGLFHRGVMSCALLLLLLKFISVATRTQFPRQL